MQEVLSIRIPKLLKEKIRKYKDVDWKRYVIEAIENKIKQLEAEKNLKRDRRNKDIESSKIPAWKIMREDRDASHRFKHLCKCLKTNSMKNAENTQTNRHLI